MVQKYIGRVGREKQGKEGPVLTNVRVGLISLKMDLDIFLNVARRRLQYNLKNW